MQGDYRSFQMVHASKTTNFLLASGATGATGVISPRSANHVLYIQKYTYTPVVVAAQTITVKDQAATGVLIGLIPASQATPLTFDFGPAGFALTAGKALDITPAGAGPAGQFHFEAYERHVTAAVSNNTANTGN